MLAHGGAIYSLVPLVLLLSVRFARLFDLRALATGAVVIAALYGPWIAYGSYVDPNDSRLLKAHLTGGDPALRSRSGTCCCALPGGLEPGIGRTQRLRNWTAGRGSGLSISSSCGSHAGA